jgi:hypothetical protein
VLGHETVDGQGYNTSENPLTMPKDLLRKLFKSITAHMQNVDELHVTGSRRKTIYQLFERNTSI